MKRMSRSVLEKCETNVDIRFIKKQKRLKKHMSRSVSYFSETDLEICNIKKEYETDVDIRFTFS